MELQTGGEQLLCVALTHLCSAATRGTAPCLFYLQKLRVRGALLIWKQKRTKANKWRPNYLTLRSEFSPYWTSGTYLMSPGCCSLVSENKAKWLMLPCYCYIIYTSHLFLWLITGLVKYIGNVKRWRVRRDSVSVNLCRMSVRIHREICVKNNFFFFRAEHLNLHLCVQLQPQQALRLGRAFFRVTNPLFLPLLREPGAKMWLLLTQTQGDPKISLYPSPQSWQRMHCESSQLSC